MARLDELERKRADAMYEVTRAQEGVDRSKRDVQTPPVPTPATGPLITIGARTCHQGDYNTVARLWLEELKHARASLRSFEGEIAKAKRRK